MAHLARESSIQKTTLEKFFVMLSDLSADELKRIKEITLPHFGKLILSVRKAHYGYNPQKRKKIWIPEKKVVSLRASQEFKRKVP